MKYVIHYDIAALILALIILIHFYHKKTIKMAQTYVFIGLLWLCLITDALDIVAALAEEHHLPALIVCLINVIYFVLFNILPFLFYFYLVLAVRRRDELKRTNKVVLFAPVGISILLIISSPLTGIVFRYSQEAGYQRGWGFPLLYVSTAIYMIGSVYITITRRMQMNMWQQVTVYFFVTTCLSSIALAVMFSHVLLLQFAATLMLLLLYMSLESPGDDEDKLLGIYNRRGFDKVVSVRVQRQTAFHVLIINMTNYISVRETAGVDFSVTLLNQIVKNLKSSLKGERLFYLSSGMLAVVVEQSSNRMGDVIAAVQKELGKPVVLGDMNIQMETVLLQLDYPQEVATMEDVIDAVDYADTVPYENSGEVMHGSAELLRMKRRESKLIQIMQNALANKSFEVYYQPIFSTSRKRFNSAEALIRLRDEELGFISPEEFIPIAEKNGMILKIGEFVFRTVCEMMAREKIWEKGIDYIEVNLSVVQCMQEDICEMLYGIMDEFDIPYYAINLEVTETTLAREILWNTMERMTVGGVTFSLDDYGTGYSNLTNILKYPFQIVKLDKSMVWYAMENEFAMRALRHTVAMIRDLSMHIVAEGVETEEQKDILQEMGCEYLQGYFFSKPVPEKDFLVKLAG